MKFVSSLLLIAISWIPQVVYAQPNTEVSDTLSSSLLLLGALIIVLVAIYALSRAVEALSERLRERL